MSENVFEVLQAGFAPALDRPFLREPGKGSHTYRDLVDRSAAFAAFLRSTGCQPGDRVVVQVDKSADAIAFYMACLQTGCIYVPLNVAYTPSEVAYYLENAEPRLLICRPEDEVKLAPLIQGTSVEHLLTLGGARDGSLAEACRSLEPDFEITPRQASDQATMLYTSGTTGKPKGARITHGNLASNARALTETWGWRSDDVLLHALPIFHVHGLFIALHCAMLYGSTVEFLPRFEPKAVRALLSRATVFMGVPTFYERLLGEPDFCREDCSHIRLFISGSAPLTESTFRRFTERSGHRILERYGMTETGILTSNPLEGERIEGTVGYPLPGVEARVVGEDGEPCPPDEVGEVEVHGAGVFRGYWNAPEKTRESFRADGFFRTGDLGTQAHDGRITLVGRGSDLIISGGYNIYPKEIEICLEEIPGILESAVVGLPHPDFGEAVTAFVVTEESSAFDAAQIDSLLGDRLARFKHPKKVFRVSSLPRNAMGKIQKALLRSEHAKFYETTE